MKLSLIFPPEVDASCDYELDEYREGDLVKLSIMINGDPVDALALVVHRTQAVAVAISVNASRSPRPLLKIAIQAAIGGKIIARETRSALRKDVTAKCYGGDAVNANFLINRKKDKTCAKSEKWT